MIALIAAAGETTSQSIINLKEKAATLRSMSYDELVMKSSYKPVTETLPEEYKLYQNYPNPFNPTTTIEFDIKAVISNSADGNSGEVRNLKDFSSQAPRNDMVNVKLKIYDILGREVKTLLNKPMQPGRHKVEFDASGLASGVYFYQLQAGDFIHTKKMVLIR
ncbi:MAG: T9SS type A sorting domain-containing protein [Melioribacteraceae bacterium]|nr:T9SS type A sorting domain-containing protein [Melioribacteraceae bacterium]MCF8356775.1 T9SS type A sorting domain-containing protein [Melioribacteraceae bacterium]MCF8396137.1 T9SS type A sorting domain-containing protein [Melioribacteraceae bacterium]MCF8421097.1 T9SS type A sorting domain-containing protein [Melioribacteraceae bacterium]